MKITYNKLRMAVVIYSVIPIIIFFLGWLSLLFALIFIVLIAVGIMFMVKSSNENDGEVSFAIIPPKIIIAIAFIAFLWCLLAGQGGFIHQSSDHVIRNAIFRDLIKMDWPVVYDDNQMLSYYIAQWMVPAIFGKIIYAITGSIFAGYLAGDIFLLIWSSIGCFIALMLIAVITHSKEKSQFILAVIMFILFSGLDIVGSFIFNYNNSGHLEWWFKYAQFSSVTTCLFWVFNQAIVCWLVTLCIINETKIKNFAMLGILILPFGPFPFVGIIIICFIKACVILFDKSNRNKIKSVIKSVFSIQNVTLILGVGIPYCLYYLTNAIASNEAVYYGEQINVGFRFHLFITQAISEGNISTIILFILKFMIFLFLEAGVFVLLIALYRKKKILSNMTFIISSATLILIPLFQIGSSYDFSMRVSIPILIYILVEFIKMILESLPKKDECKNFESFIKTKPLLLISILVLAVGAMTPVTEFNREICNTFVFGYNPQVDYFEFESLNGLEEKNNFTSSDYNGSIFYKYLSKK